MEAKVNLFDMIGKRMDWLGQRQRVLASNIANADTPEYVPRDVKDNLFKRILRRQIPPVKPAATHDQHMQGTVVRDGPADVARQKDTYETSPAGNAVILEEQLIKVAETQANYQTMTNLYRKHMDLLRLALSGGNR
jgi:flagellar basal-body rod protein FlgB